MPNPILVLLTRREEELHELARALYGRGVMNEEEYLNYSKPGQSIKYEISMLVRAVQRRLDSLPPELLEGSDLLGQLAALIEPEVRLMRMLDEEESVRELLGLAGYEATGELEVDRRFSKINYPLVVREVGTSPSDPRPGFFIRYSGLLGQFYVNRTCPGEVVFQQLLAENALCELVGDAFTTRTLYPSLAQAAAWRQRPEPEALTERLRQRVLVQPDYSLAAHTLLQEDDYVRVGAHYGEIVGLIQARTYGQNLRPTGTVRAFFPEVRDRTVQEYGRWLRRSHWVPNMYRELRDAVITEDSARGDAMRSIRHRLDGLWDRSAQRSIALWKRGAVLVPPDLSPRNSFVDGDGRLRIFDLDNLLLLDPSYHTGRCLNILLRSAREMRSPVWDTKTLLDAVAAFRSALRRTLEANGAPYSPEEPQVCANTGAFAAVNYVSYYLMSADALSLGDDQIRTVMDVGRSILDYRG